MVCVSLLKGKGLFLSIIVYLIFYPVVGYSEVFNVTNKDELREALSIAESNGEDDIINLAAGLYETFGEPFEYSSDEDFALIIEGAGASLTILDGSQMNGVVEINSLSDLAVISIKKITIQNGFRLSIPGVISKSEGAGIYVMSQELIIKDCEFINNSLSRAGHGGGLYASAQTITLSGNLFTGNSASFSGGGASISTSHLNLSGNQFIGNSSKLEGGGLTMVGRTEPTDNFVLNNNIIAQNFISGSLGAAAYFAQLDTITLTNNILTMNSADTMGGIVLAIDRIPPSYSESNKINVYNNIVIANEIIDGSDILFRTETLPFPTPPPPNVELTPTNV